MQAREQVIITQSDSVPMTVKIGFIGTGRMASAMIGGILSDGLYRKEEIIGCAPSEGTRNKMASEFGVKMYENASEVAKLTDFLVLGIKPVQVSSLFTEENLELGAEHLVMSIVAGVKIATLKGYVPDAKIVRVMPNHCCLVGEGAAGYSRGPGVTDDDLMKVKSVLTSSGLAVEVDEEDLDAVTGLAGSSPAFMYMILDAMADAGEIYGIPRNKSLKLAAQSMLGAAKMILSDDRTPEELVDNVCSPGGTTIEGVKVLKESNLKGIIVNAVKASIDRSIEMSEE